MVVVSDTSVLVALSQVGQLRLLNRLYGRLLVPSAVWHELTVTGAGKPGSSQVQEAGWIEMRYVSNRQLVIALLQTLDAGEAEAIALALELNADLLLMDERLGRKTAQHFGLELVGVIGILVQAKSMGFIQAVKPIIDQLRDKVGFRISNALYERVLLDQGENEASGKINLLHEPGVTYKTGPA